jgi:TetR/AcrR family fatty acid metabolism transcriptional regulator
LKREKQLEKRSSILEAAVSVFSREGYPNARMQEIATKAGIGKGTIYQYFKGKKHLFQQVVKEGIDQYVAGLKNEIKGCIGIEQILKKIVTFSFSFLENHSDVLKMIESHRSLIDESMLKWLYDRKNKITDLLVKTIVEKTEKKGMRSYKDAELAANCFFGMMISVVQEKVFHKKEFDIEEVSDRIVKIFLHGYEQL